jgi:DGQHR domain-containing protein
VKDVRLKKQVIQIIENCQLDNLTMDTEVQLNILGEKDELDNYLTEKEIDVVAKFSYAGKQILFLFECEDSRGAKGVKKEYRDYEIDIRNLVENRNTVRVIKATNNVVQSRHFRDFDFIKVCFVYGSNFLENAMRVCLNESRRYGFLVWSNLALSYYQKISSILGRWTRYELFKDFSLELENETTFRIKVIELKQKNKTMYLGRIHPGQLLKIGYVLRRASEKTDAYQRMLSKERIAAIGEFISSPTAQSFIPNAVIVVFDSDPSVRQVLQYDGTRQELIVPLKYCSAWIMDGQHRAYGFIGTPYEEWTQERFEPFELPIILFLDLPETIQTQTFININYYQKRIKAGLLCDLTALTKDLQHKLTWPSLIGRELNQVTYSPLKDAVKVSELHTGNRIGLSSLVQYGLLETLLGYKSKTVNYSGPLFTYASFNRSEPFDSPDNVRAFRRQLKLLIRFLDAVRKNTQTDEAQTDPWRNTRDYSLLKPTAINALFMVLAKILQKYPDGRINFEGFLRPLSSVSFERDYVASMGGGWKGFRVFANKMIMRLNKGKHKRNRLRRYGQKDKV